MGYYIHINTFVYTTLQHSSWNVKDDCTRARKCIPPPSREFNSFRKEQRDALRLIGSSCETPRLDLGVCLSSRRNQKPTSSRSWPRLTTRGPVALSRKGANQVAFCVSWPRRSARGTCAVDTVLPVARPGQIRDELSPPDISKSYAVMLGNSRTQINERTKRAEIIRSQICTEIFAKLSEVVPRAMLQL